MAEHTPGTPDDEPLHRVLTVPNLISFARLGLVPVFLWLIVAGDYAAALIVLVIASVSDALDGWLARTLKQISNLGILLDPIADRLYILAALIGLSWRGLVPWWVLALIVSRDILLVVLALVLWRNGHMGIRGQKGRFRRGAIPVTKLGKTATFLLLFGLPTVLFSALLPSGIEWVNVVGWVLVAVGSLLYWGAGIDYARHTRQRVLALSASRRFDSD
ncbi:MAG TPA: CDP-alcohol phosphatidyltransferase family protein [Microbacteriaceae bacterium]|nr:CDP-alcohol phosphatidyltransferase family protein [Microbacteriaceae bacterium]